MTVKVTRAKRVAKQRVRGSVAAERPTATDQRLLEQAAKEDAEGRQGPASTLRSIRARVAAAKAVEEPRMSAEVREEIAARPALGEVRIPMTLNDVCALMGRDCQPDEFAATAFECLADQLDAVAQFAENGPTGNNGYEMWKVVNNIAERMRCAGEVATWLECETTPLSGSEVRR